MSASGGESGGDPGSDTGADPWKDNGDGEPEGPPVRKHGTNLEWCMSEEGEERLVVYQPRHDERWIDAAGDDVSDLEEMR